MTFFAAESWNIQYTLGLTHLAVVAVIVLIVLIRCSSGCVLRCTRGSGCCRRAVQSVEARAYPLLLTMLLLLFVPFIRVTLGPFVCFQGQVCACAAAAARSC